MDDKQKIEIMAATVKPIIQFIEERRKSRFDLLNTLSSQSIENLPESIRKTREEEASRLRAVMQEQEDILTTIKVLYPNG